MLVLMYLIRLHTLLLLVFQFVNVAKGHMLLDNLHGVATDVTIYI